NVLKYVTGTVRAPGLCVRMPVAGDGKTIKAVLVVKPVKVKMAVPVGWSATVAAHPAVPVHLQAARLPVAVIRAVALPVPAAVLPVVQAVVQAVALPAELSV